MGPPRQVHPDDSWRGASQSKTQDRNVVRVDAPTKGASARDSPGGVTLPVLKPASGTTPSPDILAGLWRDYVRGDLFWRFLPAGRVPHNIGAGAFIAEI